MVISRSANHHYDRQNDIITINNNVGSNIGLRLYMNTCPYALTSKNLPAAEPLVSMHAKAVKFSPEPSFSSAHLKFMRASRALNSSLRHSHIIL